jgi:transcriptional regulator with XRE-family HTH domain
MPATKKSAGASARARAGARPKIAPKSAARSVPKAPHEDFGSRLAAFRTAAALTQSQRAERLGVSRRQIAYYESGTGRPPGALLALLADLFQVSTDVLLGREVAKAPASRISSALLVQLQQAEKMGSDVCRRLERVLQQFIVEEKRKRVPSARRDAKTTRGKASGARRRAR